MRRLEPDGARCASTLLLVAVALSCGGQVGDEARTGGASAAAPPTPARSEPPRAAPSEPPRASPVPTPARAMPAPPDPPAQESEGYYAVDAVRNILIANCGICHNANAPIEASAGIAFIGDVDQLVAAGLIVPLRSARSRIVRVMVDGSMPPPSSGLPRVTEADIDMVAQYIDNPRFWPDVIAPALPDAAVETQLADAGADGG